MNKPTLLVLVFAILFLFTIQSAGTLVEFDLHPGSDEHQPG